MEIVGADCLRTCTVKAVMSAYYARDKGPGWGAGPIKLIRTKRRPALDIPLPIKDVDAPPLDPDWETVGQPLSATSSRDDYGFQVSIPTVQFVPAVDPMYAVQLYFMDTLSEPTVMMTTYLSNQAPLTWWPTSSPPSSRA